MSRHFARRGRPTAQNRQVLSFSEHLAEKKDRKDDDFETVNNLGSQILQKYERIREANLTANKSVKIGIKNSPVEKRQSGSDDVVKFGQSQVKERKKQDNKSDKKKTKEKREKIVVSDIGKEVKSKKTQQRPSKPDLSTEDLSKINLGSLARTSERHLEDQFSVPVQKRAETKAQSPDHRRTMIRELDSKDISTIEIGVKNQKERVSKYLNRSSVCSRRQAERMIEQGIVRVNGRKILSNVEIDPLKDEVSLFTKKGEYFPMKETTKVWLFYKPRGMICTHKDPHGRPTIFEYIRSTGAISEQFVISVGRLDYNSEGLMILTNDGELARTLEMPSNKIQRTYRVRVHGRFDDKKLTGIRNGAVIKGIQYGPFICNVDSYQTTNTWVKIQMTQGKNREIRKVMQKNSLRVNRLKRLTYGPYNLGKMASGEIREDFVRPELKRLIYLAKRAALKEVEAAQPSEEEITEQITKKLEGRLLDPLSILKKASQTRKALANEAGSSQQFLQYDDGDESDE